MLLDGLTTPIVLAPLAGGPSTPELTAAVSEAGGFGFAAAGYLSPEALQADIRATRRLTGEPFGVNVFVAGPPGDRAAVETYARSLAPEAERLGVALGEPRYDDDHWRAKLDLLLADPVPVVSFTFGCPSAEVVAAFKAVGSEVWVTVTTVPEGVAAQAVGADVLVAQGAEAGGHRGTWDDHDPQIEGLGILTLVQFLRARTSLPVVAAGGIATPSGLAAALAAGARSAALGTAFLRSPEAGTTAVHRAALAGSQPTALTRAFTGRTARGIRNRMLDEHGVRAPSAYPEVHHLTSPLRRAGRERGDSDVVNLWAGQAYPLARDVPAGEIVERLAAGLTA